MKKLIKGKGNEMWPNRQYFADKKSLKIRNFGLCLLLMSTYSLGYDRSGTFIPLLITAVANTAGPILEIGCGDNSTLLLHALCSVDERSLMTITTDKNLHQLFCSVAAPWHQLLYDASFEQIDTSLARSVVLIDYVPQAVRMATIINLRPKTEIFVIHDSDEINQSFDILLNSFKYRYDDKHYVPNTTLVSDTIDVNLLIQRSQSLAIHDVTSYHPANQYDAYGTHLIPLLVAVVNTDGPILEMGSGHNSTPALHALCSATGRYLLTTETDKKWMNQFSYLEQSWHQFQYVPVYDDDFEVNPKPHLWDSVGANIHWGVVFVDHRPAERRKVDIARLKGQADIIVVHDTEGAPCYDYESVLKTFKYRYDYKKYSPWTTLVSDSIDVLSLFK